MKEITEMWAADKNPKLLEQRGMVNSEGRKRRELTVAQARDRLNALSLVVTDPTTPAILRQRGLEMFKVALDARRAAKRLA